MQTPHPVLDRSPALRAGAHALGFTCRQESWHGWQIKHEFVCGRGHVFWALPGSVAARVSRCSVCLDEAKLRRLHERAAAAQVECLDSAWHGAQALYHLRCAQGHTWRNTPRNLACPQCRRKASSLSRLLPDGLERLQRLAAERGGVCLSHAYQGHANRHRFRCAQGHEWETAASEVLRGAWCRACANADKKRAYRRADGLARLQQAAVAKGGQCLSEDYTGNKQRYRFRCAQGHEWSAQGARIVRGAWCPTCAVAQLPERYRLADGLEQLRSMAAAKGGECLSEEYLGQGARHRFRCAHGHEWSTFAAVIFRGNWCLRCAQRARRLGIEAARQAAHERGGQCLSDVYENTQVKMTWMCHRGHVWQARFTQIRRGQWCPQCAHLARITNKHSKARSRYEISGRHADRKDV